MIRIGWVSEHQHSQEYDWEPPTFPPRKSRPYSGIKDSWWLITRWWFQIFFIFNPFFWGNDPIWRLHIFQMGWFNHQLGNPLNILSILAPSPSGARDQPRGEGRGSQPRDGEDLWILTRLIPLKEYIYIYDCICIYIYICTHNPMSFWVVLGSLPLFLGKSGSGCGEALQVYSRWRVRDLGWWEFGGDIALW